MSVPISCPYQNYGCQDPAIGTQTTCHFLSTAQPSSRIEETAIFRHSTRRSKRQGIAWIPSPVDLANNSVDVLLNFAWLILTLNINPSAELRSKGTFNDSPSPSHVIARHCTCLPSSILLSSPLSRAVTLSLSLSKRISVLSFAIYFKERDTF